MANICPWCNCDLDVEKEVFGKRFTGHTCRGSYEKLQELEGRELNRTMKQDKPNSGG